MKIKSSLKIVNLKGKLDQAKIKAFLHQLCKYKGLNLKWGKVKPRFDFH